MKEVKILPKYFLNEIHSPCWQKEDGQVSVNYQSIFTSNPFNTQFVKDFSGMEYEVVKFKDPYTKLIGGLEAFSLKLEIL